MVDEETMKVGAQHRCGYGTGSAMNRYPTQAPATMNRGFDGRGSLFFRSDAMWTRTVSAVVPGALRQTLAMMCSMNIGLPAFDARSSSRPYSVGVKWMSRPPWRTLRRSRSIERPSNVSVAAVADAVLRNRSEERRVG